MMGVAAGGEVGFGEQPHTGGLREVIAVREVSCRCMSQFGLSLIVLAAITMSMHPKVFIRLG